MDWMKLAPLAAIFLKDASQLPDEELMQIARHAADDNANELYPLLVELRDGADKSTKVAQILGTPVAKKILGRLKAEREAAQNVVFCKCPECSFAFETDLN